MIEIKQEKITEINLNNETKIGVIKFAPISSCIVIGIFGILCIIGSLIPSTKLWALLVLGLLCVGLAVINFTQIKDKITMALYQSFMILYDPDDVTLGTKINYEDVDEWNIVPNSNSVRFLLSNGQEKFKDTYAIDNAYKALMEVMPAKEKLEKEKIANRAKPLKFRNPFKK